MTKDIAWWEGKPYDLYFDEETHTYFLEGEDVEFQPVISTTQILHLKFPHKYDGVNEVTLKKASERGTAIHEAIQKFETDGTPLNTEVEELRGYLVLKSYYSIKAKLCEQPILFKIGNVWVAGRFDMLADVKNLITEKIELALNDIKTTAQLDIDYLTWQLNMYRYGWEMRKKPDSNEKPIEALYGIHLKKDKKKLQKIEIITNKDVKTELQKLLKKGRI